MEWQTGGALGTRTPGKRERAVCRRPRSAFQRRWRTGNLECDMYKIIGADGTSTASDGGRTAALDYRGRVNAQTLVQPDGSAEWKPLSAIPNWRRWSAECSGCCRAVAGPRRFRMGNPPTYSVDPTRQVQGRRSGWWSRPCWICRRHHGFGAESFRSGTESYRHPGGEPMERFLNTWAGGLALWRAWFTLLCPA